MGRFVIVAYAPRAGMETRLLAAVRKHQSVLRNHDLVTDKPAYLMRSGGGAVIEVFEWRSAESIDRAHGTTEVKDLWAEFEACCEYTPLSTLEETSQPFAEFESIEL